MKLSAVMCRAIQDKQVIVKSSDKTWSIGRMNEKSLQYFCHRNPINSMKRHKDMTLEDEPHRSEGVQYAPREESRALLIAPE